MFKSLLIQGKQNPEESWSLENTRPLQNFLLYEKANINPFSFTRNTQIHLKRSLMINLYLHEDFGLKSEVSFGFKSACKSISSQYDK